LPKRRRWAVGIVLVLLCTLTSVVVAYYYLMIDQGLQAAENKGLVFHLNQTALPTTFATVPTQLVPGVGGPQTQSGIQVKLNWAYADENRAAWQITVTGLAIPAGAQIDDYICSPWITTAEGVHIDDPGRQVEILKDQPGSPIQITYVAYPHLDPSLYDHLTLNLDLTIGPCGPWWNYQEVYTGPGPTPTPPPLIGNYHLTFRMPVYKGLTTTPNQTVEAGGISMRLENITFTPSYTTALLCYTQPLTPKIPETIEWMFSDVLLQVDEGEAISPDQIQAGSQKDCVEVGFAVASDHPPLRMVITVPELSAYEGDSGTLSPEFQQMAMENLSRQGIRVEFVPSGDRFWQILEKPAGMTEDGVDQAVRDLLVHTIEGPWVFTIRR
jgi:hypothetical protein